MITDHHGRDIREFTIVRGIHSIPEFMITKIQHLAMSTEVIGSILIAHPMSQHIPQVTLLYIYHPVESRWVLIDSGGIEWETV